MPNACPEVYVARQDKPSGAVWYWLYGKLASELVIQLNDLPWTDPDEVAQAALDCGLALVAIEIPQ